MYLNIKQYESSISDRGQENKFQETRVCIHNMHLNVYVFVCMYVYMHTYTNVLCIHKCNIYGMYIYLLTHSR